MLIHHCHLKYFKAFESIYAQILVLVPQNFNNGTKYYSKHCLHFQDILTFSSQETNLRSMHKSGSVDMRFDIWIIWYWYNCRVWGTEILYHPYCSRLDLLMFSQLFSEAKISIVWVFSVLDFDHSIQRLPLQKCSLLRW